MTNKEAYEIMLEAKLRIAYVPARNPTFNVKRMEEAFNHALIALAYFANMEQLSDEISDRCQKALGEKWIAERKEK